MSPQLALYYAAEELFNAHLYEWLARNTHLPTLQEVLRQFAEQERAHYHFWQQWVPQKVSFPRWRLRWYQLLSRLFGVSFILCLVEQREHQAIEVYRQLVPTLPPPAQAALNRFIQEEEKHEAKFLEAIQAEEPRLRYLGFIVLGLSDAIIEVTGVHAGFLGLSYRPLTAGIAGLIVGFAASISMASAAYLQAKQNTTLSSVRSAIYTGGSYLSAVVLLAMPYFTFSKMLLAFAGSVILALILIGGFTYYNSVIFNRPFRKEAVESTAVLTATSLLSYGFGELLRYLFPEIPI
ncbi:MAG: rubrerythrin family protein [Bacteroidia bacterium]|nr:rubrerythrin family protein [Bacteroidia bacterium]MDW8015287.1 rubrerythrin family protein [Bacteroidia bacterium]